MNSLSNSAPSEKMDGERGGRDFFLGGVLFLSNSLLNRALDCCARRRHPELGEGEPEGCGNKGQGLRDSTHPLDGCVREKGAGSVAASDGRGKILTLNGENAKMQKTYKFASFLLFGRVSFRLGLRQRRQGKGES